MTVNIQGKTATLESNLAMIPKMQGIDTRAKLVKLQQNKIRDYYSRIFKNENQSLSKQGITTRSSIGATSKTRKKIGFKVPAKKLTLKAIAANTDMI
jgi:hypothetical protein